jgi:hypothetical protein
MPGGAGPVTYGTNDVTRTEAPVTLSAYLTCVFAAFGGILFGMCSFASVGERIWLLIVFQDMTLATSTVSLV